MQFQPTKSVGRLQMVFSWMHWKNILEYSSGFHGNHSINQQITFILTVSCKYYGNVIVKEVLMIKDLMS